MTDKTIGSGAALDDAGSAVPLFTFAGLAALPGIAHGVSTRHGGASADPFTSLNVGLHVGDDPAIVVANRRRLAAALGLAQGDLVVAAQVHGGVVAVVGAADRGRGARDHASAVAGADALITDAPGVGLLVMVADCVPLLLADPVRRAVGVVHAGWRGLAADVVGNAVRAMARAFGSAPADLRAGIGPCIGAADYAVGDEVFTAMVARFGPSAAGWFAALDGERRSLDLAAAARDQLRRAGLAADRIEVAGVSTATDDRFYSHRASGGRTGRFAGLIALAR